MDENHGKKITIFHIACLSEMQEVNLWLNKNFDPLPLLIGLRQTNQAELERERGGGYKITKIIA